MSTRNVGVTYGGEAGSLMTLAMKTGFLTVITLGIYRFWAKTRIRKYFWSSTGIEGDRFEYTGTGLEKFLGFLVAIVLLAIYLGIVQVLLTFVGLGFMLEPRSQAEVLAQLASIYLTLLAALPLIYFAVYRSQRYRMARTRFRGIRFGMDSAAWGYAGRALGYMVLTVVTLGILTPLATFKLGKYMADRSWYGDAKFEQQGKWTALYSGLWHVLIGVVLLVVGGGVLGWSAEASPVGQPSGWAMLILFVAYGWLIFGIYYYQIRSSIYMVNNRTLAGEVTFVSNASIKTLMLRAIGGVLLVGLAAFAGMLLLMIPFGILGGLTHGGASGGSALGAMIIGGVLTIVLYIVFLVFLGALSLILITQRLLSHFLETLEVRNVDALENVQQRAYDKGADAEGFAEALDIGGAI